MPDFRGMQGRALGGILWPLWRVRHSGLQHHGSSLVATLPFSSTDHIRGDRSSSVVLESASHVSAKFHFTGLVTSPGTKWPKIWFRK